MHELTIRTRFTFGDRVKYDSPTQKRSGSGIVRVITVGEDGHIDYMIGVESGEYLQGGILEGEMTLLVAKGSEFGT